MSQRQLSKREPGNKSLKNITDLSYGVGFVIPAIVVLNREEALILSVETSDV